MSTSVGILVVDDDRLMVRTLVDILGIKGYQAHPAHSAQEALEKIENEKIDCVLSDIKMPGVGGVELCRSIKERNPLLPVVLMTAHSDDRLVRDGVREGAVAVLSKPLDIEAILSLFSSLRIKRSIAVVDDDPEFCTAVEDILRKRGFSVTAYTDPLEALKTFDETIHMILLGMKPGGGNGLDTLRKVRELYSQVPVILVAGCRKGMKESLGAVLATGVHTCLYKPLQTEELLEAVTEVYHRDLAGVLPICKKEK